MKIEKLVAKFRIERKKIRVEFPMKWYNFDFNLLSSPINERVQKKMLAENYSVFDSTHDPSEY